MTGVGDMPLGQLLQHVADQPIDAKRIKGLSGGNESVPAVVLASDTTSSGTTLNIAARGATFPWQEMVTAGKTLQVRVIAYFLASASSTLDVCAVLSTAPSGGTRTDDTNKFATVTTSSTSAVTMDSGWVTVDTGLLAVADYAEVNVALQRGGSAVGTAKAGTTVFYQWA